LLYSPGRPVPASEGYDLVAESFDQWEWCTFWRHNEAPFVKRWIGSLPAGLGLDAGSGTGCYSQEIAAAGHRSVAVDISLSMLKVLRSKSTGGPLPSTVRADVLQMPFRSGQFDWVLCTRVLSHISDARHALGELARVLRNGGRALVTDVHPQHPYTFTSVDTRAGSVPIRTYKHGLNGLNRLVERDGAFSLCDLREYRSNDLSWQPRQGRFEKLFKTGGAPVFYIMELQRA
jgi:ubiquinone/menaquinone biosynthesis C-methylase UbiE